MPIKDKVGFQPNTGTLFSIYSQQVRTEGLPSKRTFDICDSGVEHIIFGTNYLVSFIYIIERGFGDVRSFLFLLIPLDYFELVVFHNYSCFPLQYATSYVSSFLKEINICKRC